MSKFGIACIIFLAVIFTAIRQRLLPSILSTYERVKGLNGFARVCKNLERYMSGALTPDNVHLKYIIFELNNSLAEIKAFLALCAQLGISNVQYSLNFQELNGAGPSLKTLLGAAFFLAILARRLTAYLAV